MLSCSARFFASCIVWSVFLGPGSLKYTAFVSVLVMFLFSVYVCCFCGLYLLLVFVFGLLYQIYKLFRCSYLKY